MISKDLTVTLENEEEGLVLTLKTVSKLGPGKVAITGDPGVHNLEELKKAVQELENFK